MSHIFSLSLDTGWETSQLEEFLIEQGLIKNIISTSWNPSSGEKAIRVVVSNKNKFFAYLNKKNRNNNDPRYIIKSWRYEGVTGNAAKSSREGRLATARVKKFKEAKRTKNKAP